MLSSCILILIYISRFVKISAIMPVSLASYGIVLVCHMLMPEIHIHKTACSCCFCALCQPFCHFINRLVCQARMKTIKQGKRSKPNNMALLAHAAATGSNKHARADLSSSVVTYATSKQQLKKGLPKKFCRKRALAHSP